MSWDLYKEVKPKWLFVSKYNHLYDILGRYSAGELNVKLLYPSNQFNIPFFHLSLRTTKNQEKSNKSNYLKTRSTLLFCPLHANHNTKFEFRFTKIRIFHSFFTGFSLNPIAFKRGVKIISCPITEELDEGPIIEQDITRVSQFCRRFHHERFERTVLARAIKLHARKVMVYSNKTVIRVLTPPFRG
jgi:formyltetrahydrofolate deformylase